MINLRASLDAEVIREDWLMERMRIHRDRLLAESDWTQTVDAPVDKAAWAEYRQALRDFPATWVPSEEVNFPEPPVVG